MDEDVNHINVLILSYSLLGVFQYLLSPSFPLPFPKSSPPRFSSNFFPARRFHLIVGSRLAATDPDGPHFSLFLPPGFPALPHIMCKNNHLFKPLQQLRNYFINSFPKIAAFHTMCKKNYAKSCTRQKTYVILQRKTRRGALPNPFGTHALLQ